MSRNLVEWIIVKERRVISMLGIPGWMEIGVVATVVLLLFGKRIPDTMKAFGKGILEFKKGVRGIEDDVDEGQKKLYE